MTNKQVHNLSGQNHDRVRSNTQHPAEMSEGGYVLPNWTMVDSRKRVEDITVNLS